MYKKRFVWEPYGFEARGHEVEGLGPKSIRFPKKNLFRCGKTHVFFNFFPLSFLFLSVLYPKPKVFVSFFFWLKLSSFFLFKKKFKVASIIRDLLFQLFFP